MNEEQLWAVAWKCVAAVVMTLIISISGCVANTHIQVSRDIRSGADPLLVACAHNSEMSHNYCLVNAAKR